MPNAENDHGPAESTGSAFTRLLDGIVALRDLDATWLTVAGELLRFAEENMPPASSWAGLAPGQPDGTVVLVSAVTQAALATITREVSEGSKLSFATEEERETLRSVALAQLAEAPFDRAMNEATTAIGIAEAIDDLTGHTFMPWYKGEGELTVGGGVVYPIREHDPRGWLGENSANTRPSHLPSRQLSSTSRLQVASKDIEAFSYVLDFYSWDILSDLGADEDLIAAVGQTNAHLDEFNIELAEEPVPTYANHGPDNHESHAGLVRELISASGAANAEILLLPEYGLASASRDLVVNQLPSIDKVPRLVVSGVSSGTDDEGYIINDAMMIVTPAANGVSRVIHLPPKLYPAEVEGLTERIRRGSEIRVFLTERWTIATLICFDAMDAQIIDQLAAFGVNLLLVPALSEKTAAIIGSATTLCHRSQAFVVVATGPARWESARMAITSPPEERSEAVFAGPYATSPDPTTASSTPDECGRTNLWTFRYPTRELAEYAVHNS